MVILSCDCLLHWVDSYTSSINSRCGGGVQDAEANPSKCGLPVLLPHLSWHLALGLQQGLAQVPVVLVQGAGRQHLQCLQDDRQEAQD